MLDSVAFLVSPFFRERGLHIEKRSKTWGDIIRGGMGPRRAEGLRLRSHRCPGGFAFEGGGVAERGAEWVLIRRCRTYIFPSGRVGIQDLKSCFQCLKPLFFSF